MTFKIFTIPHTLFAAQHLVKQLNKLGHDASICNEILDDEFIYIIYNAAADNLKIPKNYIVYQTEISTSHWFTPKYFNIIKGALAVWDYSESNVNKYRAYNRNILIVPPGIEPQPTLEKDIPLLFYGWIKGSQRRFSALRAIERKMPIKIVTATMGSEMWDILSRTKTVVNIHYYNNSPLELFRINEALSFGCHVISEIPYSPVYRNFVHFYQTESQLLQLIKKCEIKPFEYDLNPLDNLEQINSALIKLISNGFRNN